MTFVYQRAPPPQNRWHLLTPAGIIMALILLWSFRELQFRGSSTGLRLCIAFISRQPASPSPAQIDPPKQQTPRWNTASCQLDTEGAWSIGLFSGPSPLNLTPYQAPSGVGQPGRTPPAARNPILTCASVTDPPSNFVADPFLWTTNNGSWYIFFETKTNTNNQGDIGVAESPDYGASWQYLGIALDEPWHLSYPFLFSFGGETYMLPEAGGSGALRVYRAAAFPLRWEPAGVLMNGSFADTTLREWEGKWWAFTSPADTLQHALQVLHIYYADSPLGPWQPHAMNPVVENIRGGRSAGRVISHEGRLLRFGQDCSQAYGHAVVAYQIQKLTPSKFEQAEVPLSIVRTQPGTAAWNGVRHHHVDAHQMPDGTWLVAMDGDNRRN